MHGCITGCALINSRFWEKICYVLLLRSNFRRIHVRFLARVLRDVRVIVRCQYLRHFFCVTNVLGNRVLIHCIFLS